MQQEPLLDGKSAAESGEGAVRAHNTMSRDDYSERVGANGLPHSASRFWPADGVSHIAVCPHGAGGNLHEGLPNGTLKIRAAVQIQRAGEVHRLPVCVT